MVQRKKYIGMKTRFYTYQLHLHCIGVRNKKAEKPLRRFSEIGNLGRLQLKLQFAGDKRDEFGIRGFFLPAFYGLKVYISEVDASPFSA